MPPVLPVTDPVPSCKGLTDSEILAIACIISFKGLFLLAVPRLAKFAKCSIAVLH